MINWREVGAQSLANVHLSYELTPTSDYVGDLTAALMTAV